MMLKDTVISIVDRFLSHHKVPHYYYNEFLFNEKSDVLVFYAIFPSKEFDASALKLCEEIKDVNVILNVDTNKGYLEVIV